MKTFLRKYIPYSLAVLLMIGSIGYLQTRTALAAPAFVATTAAKCNASCTATTGGINTTTANFCVATVLEFLADPSSGTMSDSLSNTWHHLTTLNDTAHSSTESVFWYTYNNGSAFNAGSSQTFSFTGTSYPTMIVSCYSGVLTTSDPFDQQNGLASQSTNTFQSGSITPTLNNELLITSAGDFSGNGAGIYTVNSGFTKTGNDQNNNSLILYQAYFTQSPAAAINPTWIAGSIGAHIAIIASFKPSTGVVATPQFTAVTLIKGSMSIGGGQTETPCQTGCGAVSSTSLGGGNYGYNFTANASGLATGICINVGNTNNYSAVIYTSGGTQLAIVNSFTGVTNTWSCKPISLRLTAGTSYIVSVLLTSTQAFNKAANLTPFTVGDFTINNGLYNTSIGFPNTSTTTINGIPDLQFVPDVIESGSINN